MAPNWSGGPAAINETELENEPQPSAFNLTNMNLLNYLIVDGFANSICRCPVSQVMPASI